MLNTLETPAHKLADAYSASQCINTSELQTAASNCRTFGESLARDGRIHEAAFWAKMGLKLADALVDISAGADARRERIIYQDLLRARLFDLRIAVNADDNLSSAKADSATNRNLRRSMTEAR